MFLHHCEERRGEAISTFPSLRAVAKQSITPFRHCEERSGSVATKQSLFLGVMAKKKEKTRLLRASLRNPSQ
ncbi:MAG: hypothetical protein ACPLPS_00715 [bacterium]